MGIRHLLVTADLFVEFFKAHDELARTYTVDRPLPDDARFIETLAMDNGCLALVLESAEWMGRSDIPLEPPCITVHYLGAPHGVETR